MRAVSVVTGPDVVSALTVKFRQSMSAPSLKHITGRISFKAAEGYIKSDMHQVHSGLSQVANISKVIYNNPSSQMRVLSASLIYK